MLEMQKATFGPNAATVPRNGLDANKRRQKPVIGNSVVYVDAPNGEDSKMETEYAEEFNDSDVSQEDVPDGDESDEKTENVSPKVVSSGSKKVANQGRVSKNRRKRKNKNNK